MQVFDFYFAYVWAAVIADLITTGLFLTAILAGSIWALRKFLAHAYG